VGIKGIKPTVEAKLKSIDLDSSEKEAAADNFNWKISAALFDYGCF
jgi:hypothetical protein